MIRNLKKSLILSALTILLFGLAYPLFIFAIGQLMPSKSEGSPVLMNNVVKGFENIGQSFTSDEYFNGRPSAVDYNSASTGGSNKGPTNPEYLEVVNARIDSFLVHNPDVKKEEIPSDLVTASGSGIDPDISLDGAYIQIPRISKARNIDKDILKKLVDHNCTRKYIGIFGIEKVNVLKVNLELDKLK